MNTQIVRTTDIQRNFKQVLQKLRSSTSPVVVVRDSVPEAVMLSYQEYERLSMIEKLLLKSQFEHIWEGMRQRNAHVSTAILNADIKRAKRYAKRSR